MSRVDKTAEIASRYPDAESLLDIGCRDGVLRRHLPSHIRYSGADLVAVGDHVNYVGDFTQLPIAERFDIVTAVDVLEHIDGLHAAFDRMVELARCCVIVSLPNCYDLKGRGKFALQGHMGGKYRLLPEATEDRHRWLLNYPDIIAFYAAKARQHGLALTVHSVRYGEYGTRSLISQMGRIVSRVLPNSLSTHSVVGEFRFKTGSKL